MTLMVISTSLGAQVFKIPITKLIHNEPISYINFFQYFVGALLTFFIGAVTIVYLSNFAKGSEDKYEFEETEIGTNKDSETTNISAKSSEMGSVEVLKPLENFEPLLNKHETIIREEYEKNSQNER